MVRFLKVNVYVMTCPTWFTLVGEAEPVKNKDPVYRFTVAEAVAVTVCVPKSALAVALLTTLLFCTSPAAMTCVAVHVIGAPPVGRLPLQPATVPPTRGSETVAPVRSTFPALDNVNV